MASSDTLFAWAVTVDEDNTLSLPDVPNNSTDKVVLWTVYNSGPGDIIVKLKDSTALPGIRFPADRDLGVGVGQTRIFICNAIVVSIDRRAAPIDAQGFASGTPHPTQRVPQKP